MFFKGVLRSTRQWSDVMKDHRYFLSVVSAVQDAYRPQDQPDLALEHQRREVAAIIFRVGNPVAGAGRGNRTPTGLSALRILSPLRLPISPSRLAHYFSLEDDAARLLGRTRQAFGCRASVNVRPFN